MREAGGVCLQEMTGRYFPMPGAILSHGRWLGGGGMARSQGKKPNDHLNKVDLDKSQRDPPVSFGTESFRIIWNSFW